MASAQPFLLVENSFYSCFLASLWIQHPAGSLRPRTVIVCGDPPPPELLEARRQFHRQHDGERILTKEVAAELSRLYSDVTEVMMFMVRRLGIPGSFLGAGPESVFLGSDLNSDEARRQLDHVCSLGDPSTIFLVFVDQILGPWWLDLAGGRILNGHPAILPYARGVRAIEGVARLRDVELFRLAAGVTIHYVDSGIDTGPIVRAERLLDPFQFGSLSELRACLFDLMFTLLLEAADRLTASVGTLPVGVPVDRASRGRLFLRRESTPAARRNAAEAYLALCKLVHDRS